MFHIKKVTCLLALSGLATLASAETNIDLDQMVVTGTRSESLLLDLAGNTAKVSQQEIELVNPDHIEEILLRVPGMNLQRGNGAEMTIALRSPVLTGPGAGGAFLFLEDGIPMRAPAFVNNNGLSEAHYEQAGSIEVIRGPGSAFYGSNAVHGVINVLTAAPSKTLERKIDFSMGSDDRYQLKGTVSDTIGNHAYRVNFTGIEDGGWRADSGLGEQKLTLRHDYAAENGDTFKTILHLFNLNQETAGFLRGPKDDNATPNVDESLASAAENLYKNRALMKTNPDPDAYRDWWSVRLSTRWDHVLSNGNTLSITPYIRSTEMNFRQHYLPSRAIEKNGHDSLGVQSTYYMVLDGGHEVMVGLDAEYTDGHLSEIQTKPYFTYAGFNGGKKKSPQGFHYNYDVQTVTLAPFVHANGS